MRRISFTKVWRGDAYGVAPKVQLATFRPLGADSESGQPIQEESSAGVGSDSEAFCGKEGGQRH